MLRYSIAREWLHGSIGSQRFGMRAFSGGGRGRKGHGAEHTPASFDIRRKETNGPAGHVHGGPLFSGLYICRHVAKHDTFHECIFLQQTLTSALPTDASGAWVDGPLRDRFYNHGRGPHGSDGCIDPESESERKRLNQAIKGAAALVVLIVEEPGMPIPATEHLKKNVVQKHS